MKALLYTGPRQIVLADEPEPSAGDLAGEVIVRVEACGICGSDMHAYLGHDARRPAPLILGHEAAGTVVDGPLTGRRVAVNPLVTCRSCRDCLAGRQNLCRARQIISMPPRPGAFAEIIRIPQQNVFPISDALPCEVACLTEPLAVSYHGVLLAAKASPVPLSGAQALVFGGGAIGVGAAVVLRALGVNQPVIVEPNALRAEALADLSGIAIAADDHGLADDACDIVIDAVGIDATRAAASRVVRPGGVISHIGLGAGNSGLDLRKITLQEITLVGSYTYTMRDFSETLELLERGALGDLSWTEQRPLEDGPDTFRALDAGTVAASKVVLRIGLAQ